MAEALAVIGIVASIVQLVEFGTKVLERVNTFTSDSSEIPEAFRSCQNRLPLLIDMMRQLKQQSDEGKVEGILAGEVKQFIDSCVERIKAIDSLINGVLPAGNASIWTKRLAALKSLSKDKHLSRLTDQLGQDVQVLAWYQSAIGDRTTHKLLQSLMQKSLSPIDPESERIKSSAVSEWLNAVDTTGDYDAALTARLEGTCTWVFHIKEFQEWNRAYDGAVPSKALWIHGPPGFGKSVLAASVVEKLSEDGHASVATFFCAAEYDSKRAPVAILRSWINQIVRNSVSLLNAAWEIQQKNKMIKATETELWQLFDRIVAENQNCVFVVDGLDECYERDVNASLHVANYRKMFLQRLLQSFSQSNFRLLIISRYMAEMESLWTASTIIGTSARFLTYQLSQKDTANDIDLFSHSIIDQKLSTRNESIRKGLKEGIAEKAEGMFLWVRLLERRLSPWKAPEQLQKIISETPAGLYRAYKREITRILSFEDEEERDRAISILRWVMYAREPLTVQQISEALAIDSDDDLTEFPSEALPVNYDTEYINDQILGICGSLIQLRSALDSDSPKDQTVHFVHFSLEEYIRQISSDTNLPPASKILKDTALENSLLAQTCIRSLIMLDNIMDLDGPTKSVTYVETPDFKNSFMQYTIKHWPDHVHASVGQSQSLLSLLRDFFWPETVMRRFIWAYADQIEDESREKGEEESDEESDEERDEESDVERDEESDVESDEEIKEESEEESDGERREEGKDENHDDDDDDDDDNDSQASRKSIKSEVLLSTSSMYYAARFGLTDVIEYLLQEGLDVNAEGELHRSAVQVAALHGHWSAVQTLLKSGARDDFGGLVFDNSVVAAASGHSGDPTKTIRVLLEHGATIAGTGPRGMTALHFATARLDVGTVKLLIDRGADVASTTYDSTSSLHLAADCNDLEKVRVLLDHGASVNACKHDGDTPLHISARHGHTKITNTLIKKGANIDAQNHQKNSPLFLALLHRHRSVLDIMLEGDSSYKTNGKGNADAIELALQGVPTILDRVEKDPEKLVTLGSKILCAYCDDGTITEEGIAGLIDRGVDLEELDMNGFTALHLAVRSGHEQIVALLLDRGANIEARIANKERYGRVENKSTALHLAAALGKTMIMKLLISYGANVEARTYGGRTPLHQAMISQSLDTIISLCKLGANLDAQDHLGFSVIHIASLFNLQELCKTLVTFGADLNARTNDGESALHLAAESGHKDIVVQLIKHGADLHAYNEWGESSLYLAAEASHKDVVLLLAGYGADLNAALHLAVTRGHRDVILQLFDCGAESNARDKDGRAALHLAAWGNHKDIIVLLVDHGADLNARSRHGLTALHVAAGRGYRDIVVQLIDFGIDLDACNVEGLSPLSVASMEGHNDIVQTLLGAGADRNLVATRAGFTVLHRETYYGHIDVVQRLLDAGLDPNQQDWQGRTALHVALYHGYTNLIALLASAPTNVSLVDQYGRSCVDWAVIFKVEEESIMRHCDQHTLSEQVIQNHALRSSIVKIARKIAIQPDPDQRPVNLLNYLGRCLAFLGQYEDARVCFQADIIWSTEEDLAPIHPHAGCDRCTSAGSWKRITGPRFVCQTCPEIDLCLACKEKYDDGLAVLFCKGHDFLEVPGKEWYSLPAGIVDSKGETWETFLERIETEASAE